MAHPDGQGRLRARNRRRAERLPPVGSALGVRTRRHPRSLDVWHGLDDRDVGTAHAETLAGAVPGANLHLVPRTGHFALVTHIGEVLDVMAAAESGRIEARHGSRAAHRPGPGGRVRSCPPPSSFSAPASAASSCPPGVEQLGDDVDVTLIDRSDAFVFGFSKLDVMFRARTPEAVRLRYADITTPPSVPAGDDHLDRPEARRVETDLGTYRADVLVIALGPTTTSRPRPVWRRPGTSSTRWRCRGRPRGAPDVPGGNGDRGRLRRSLQMPPAPSEAAMLLDGYLRERGCATTSGSRS